MADFAGAKAAIRQLLVDGWLTTRITYQNEAPGTPWPPVGVDGFPVPFINLEVATLASAMRGAGVPGKQTWLTDGFIYVHVFVPTGAGDAQATEYATAIGEIYRAKVFYLAAPGCYVRTWAPRIDGGGSSDDDGNWFRVTMSVPFEYWHRG